MNSRAKNVIPVARIDEQAPESMLKEKDKVYVKTTFTNLREGMKMTPENPYKSQCMQKKKLSDFLKKKRGLLVSHPELGIDTCASRLVFHQVYKSLVSKRLCHVTVVLPCFCFTVALELYR